MLYPLLVSTASGCLFCCYGFHRGTGSHSRLAGPLPCDVDRTVLEVATEMSMRRTDAALLTQKGRVVGIVTDHDFTRSVHQQNPRVAVNAQS